MRKIIVSVIILSLIGMSLLFYFNLNKASTDLEKETIIKQNTEDKKSIFLDRLFTENNIYTKENSNIVYFDENIAVVTSSGNPVGDESFKTEYRKNNLLIGIFDVNNKNKMQKNGLGIVYCKDAYSLNSSCVKIFNDGIFFIDVESVTSFYYGFKSNLESIDGFGSRHITSRIDKSDQSYVRDYDNYTEVPEYDTNISGRSVKLGIYKDNEYFGMGMYDHSKLNEKIGEIEFVLPWFFN